MNGERAMKARNNSRSRKVKKLSHLNSQSKSTKMIVAVCTDLIQDPVMRKQAISFITAVDGKKLEILLECKIEKSL